MLKSSEQRGISSIEVPTKPLSLKNFKAHSIIFILRQIFSIINIFFCNALPKQISTCF